MRAKDAQETVKEKLTQFCIMHVLNQSESQQFVDDWCLRVTRLRKLVEQLKHETESCNLEGFCGKFAGVFEYSETGLQYATSIGHRLIALGDQLWLQ